MFDYFDIHSHIYFPQFDADRERVIEEMKEKKIGTITIGTGFESSSTAVELAEKHPHLFACVGQHPDDIDVNSFFDERLVTLLNHSKVVAIGECGYDYNQLSEPKEEVKRIQTEIFKKHIELALAVGKPLMLHIRDEKGKEDAYLDTLTLLEGYKKEYGERLRGNAHFFAGSPEVLSRFIALGFTVSFTGVITFTNDYDELIKATPLEFLMSETDSPFVAPVPHRGQRNSPLYVPHVVDQIAVIRGEDREVMRQTLIQNALSFFNIQS